MRYSRIPNLKHTALLNFCAAQLHKLHQKVIREIAKKFANETVFYDIKEDVKIMSLLF